VSAVRTAAARHALAAALVLVLGLAGCSGGSSPAGPSPTRGYRMGFAPIPPRGELGDVLTTLDGIALHGDAVILSSEPPWDSLLAGIPADSIVRRNTLELAAYLRGRGLRLWVYLDPGNGLDRGGESVPLVQAGRSITEPAVQMLYRRYCVAMDTLLRPDVLGVVLETNLIRAAAPAPLYTAIREVAAAAAADVRAADPLVRLSASIQLETLWGRLPPGPYAGIATDLADFPFIEVLGLSSYPYFVWPHPDSLPSDYYARVAAETSLPVAITEGGWTSAPVPSGVGSVAGSTALQARYIDRQVELLSGVRAAAWFQLTYTDLDLSALDPGLAAGLRPFSRLGVVDSVFGSKPALARWDAARSRSHAGDTGVP
jgi:hypothetical protein